MGISYSQLMIVLIVAVVLFGSRLPDVLRQVGKAYAQFRRSLSEFQYTLDDPEPNGRGRANPRIGSSNAGQARSVKSDTIDPGEDDFQRGAAPKFSPPQLSPPPSSEGN
jgi:sec-independent protein translocase protein TatA